MTGQVHVLFNIALTNPPPSLVKIIERSGLVDRLRVENQVLRPKNRHSAWSGEWEMVSDQTFVGGLLLCSGSMTLRWQLKTDELRSETMEQHRSEQYVMELIRELRDVVRENDLRLVPVFKIVERDV